MRPTINLLPLLLRRLWGGPVVVTFHDLLVPYLFPKAGPLREWANRLLARSATAVVATNPADAARLRSWGVRRVELIPIGSNIPNNPPSDFNRDLWRANHGISSETTLLAYFGFLNSTKGISDLLRALALLRERASSNVAGAYRLMMVGGGLGSSDPTNRATAAQLDTLAQSLGVDDLLLWTGFLTPGEVSAALLSADMAVLPYADGASFRRGSLMAVLEHALPVITTQTKDEGRRTKDEGRRAKDARRKTMDQQPMNNLEPRNPQSAIRNPQLDWPSLESGVNALLVPAGDAQALAVAIERLACDPSLRLALSAGSRKLALFFSWKRIAEMHRRLYNSDELKPETRAV